MTTDELEALFTKHDDEYSKFERVQHKYSRRSDLHAFILLDKILPPDDTDIVSAAEHDEIFLGVELEELAPAVTEEQVIDLIRCGVRLDEYGLAMFV